jgi:hypothetical protein
MSRCPASGIRSTRLQSLPSNTSVASVAVRQGSGKIAMAHCDHCGVSFRGMSIANGRYRFCNGVCAEKGAVLRKLDRVDVGVINEHIARAQAGPCAECAANAKVDMYYSYRAHSVLVYTSWKKRTHFCCRSCGRRHQISSIAYCMCLGWWGVPFGLVITPWQIAMNLGALLRNSNGPSNELQRIIRLNLAAALALQERRRGS